ncbi:hypothetical protein [Nonomuraea salmonea]|uniref:Leucine rich repeat variant domain-containing protein n=1 Tax=Nonomuraea salmonea TaxID=46181 RepID=A0ABV5P2R9_9ACTN
MDDQEPSHSYTIDDLDALTLLMAAHPRMAILETLSCPTRNAAREAAAASRDPRDLVDGMDVPPAEWPRELAERLLAKGAHQPTLRVLATSQYHRVRLAVAENQWAPEEALIALSRHPDLMLSEAAAANPALPVQEIDVIQTGGVLGARMGVLRHPAARRRNADWAATDPDEPVRCRAACSPLTSRAWLERLAADPCDGVRGAAATNPHTPPGSLRLLAGEPRWYTRGCVAANPSSPLDALARLAEDPEWSVRRTLAAHTSIPELVDRLAGDDNEIVRAKAAGNPACPAATLARLAASRSPARVREAVAANPATPEDVRRRLAEHDRSPYVRQAARAAQAARP